MITAISGTDQCTQYIHIYIYLCTVYVYTIHENVTIRARFTQISVCYKTY